MKHDPPSRPQRVGKLRPACPTHRALSKKQGGGEAGDHGNPSLCELRFSRDGAGAAAGKGRDRVGLSEGGQGNRAPESTEGSRVWTASLACASGVTVPVPELALCSPLPALDCRWV